MAKNATRLSIQPNTKKKSNFFVTFFFITLTVVDNKFLFFSKMTLRIVFFGR